MDKLRAQYALHKKYRQVVHQSTGSNNAAISSSDVENSNRDGGHNVSSSRTASETIISSGSGDTGKTSITSSISGNLDSRFQNERGNSASVSSYRPLGTFIPNSTSKKDMKYEAELKKAGSYESRSENIISEPKVIRKVGTTTLENHIELAAVPSPPRNSGQKKSLHSISPRKYQEIDAPCTAEIHAFIPVVIPTEAQLRWAQFHRETRAKVTKQRIEALMKSPVHLHEVEGALPSDGDSSTDENSIGRSKNSLCISKGRRALLRVSARNMQKRKEKIERLGFQMKPDSNIENMQVEEKSELHSSVADETLQFDDITAALQGTHDEDNFIHNYQDDIVSPTRAYDSKNGMILARKKSNYAKRLKGRRSIVQSPDEEEQRMKRFEDAYKLLCQVKKDSNTPDNGVISSSKRWTRDSSLPVAISIDGREYGDLQRSPTFRYEDGSKYYGPEVMGAEVNGIQLSDKSASWMTHIPKQNKKKVKFFGQNVNNGPSSILSPQKLKLLEIVDKVHMFEKQTVQVDDRSNRHRSDHYSNISKDSFKGLVTNKEALNQRSNASDFDGTENHSPALENKILSMVSTLANNRVVDTDRRSESSGEGDEKFESRVDSLMLSPRILTKRLNQAIVAVETCRWDKVRALIRANKWLADMVDVNCNQYLLHKISFYGAGTVPYPDSTLSSAPKIVLDEIIEASSSIVHKVDVDGNLPLHLACKSGNFEFVSQLCVCFPGGASVRNQEGLLPLHLAVLSGSNSKVSNPVIGIAQVLRVFPLALTVADNNGNLPIHYAVTYLSGQVGAQIVHTLMEEAEARRQSLNFTTQKIAIHRMDLNDMTHEEDLSSIEHDNNYKNSMLCVRNNLGMNPVVTAIREGAGWEVLDEFFSHDGIEEIIYDIDGDGKTILQLAISQDVCDGPSIVSILRAAPSLVNIRDEKTGALPIETACLRGLQHEVITAIALLDLPIDLDNEKTAYREKYGGSWWYLNCECDDAYSKIVEEILELCEYEQKRALCFVKNKSSETLVSRATPRCKRILRKSLRFAGRYEFVGSADKTGLPQNVKAFEALDFGDTDEGNDDALQVTLIYYEQRQDFARDTKPLNVIDFSSQQLLSPIHFFEASIAGSTNADSIQRYMAVMNPLLTLRTIVSSMNKKNYRNDIDSFERYINKIDKVFRTVAEALHYLHQKGIVHGNIAPESCGKYENGWKLTGLVGCHQMGKSIPAARMGINSPPEAVSVLVLDSGKPEYIMSPSVIASPTIDMWAFGKLMFEVILGKPLIPHDNYMSKQFAYSLGRWNEDNLAQVVSDLEEMRVSTLVTDMITHCLCPRPGSRPKSFEDILNHSYWSSCSNVSVSAHRKIRSSAGSARKQESNCTLTRRFQV